MKKYSILILALPVFLLLSVTANAQQKIKPKKCIDIIYSILDSSPRYQKLTKNLMAAVKKNKGQGYGMMMNASPNPGRDDAQDQSENYEFSLHETYPDRIVNTAHFIFNPKTKLLYEVDMADPDNPKPIPFNKKLLSAFSKACK